MPHFAAAVVDRVETDVGLVTFFVHSSAAFASCSGCGAKSSRVHGRYRRSLADVPLAGRRVRIVAAIRRFKCGLAACPQATFSEQIPGMTTLFARRTPLVTEQLVAIALALVGRAGSRLAAKLSVPCGRDLLIGLIRAQPVPVPPVVTVLGVDDFAFRRSATYGTILINMADHRPVDVLPDREAATLAAWLAEHPGVKVVCRDRSGAYAEGIRIGAPDAIQVADRFHLWQNLCKATQKTVIAHHPCLREATQAVSAVAERQPPQPPPILGPPPTKQYPLAARTKQRYADVQECLGRGLSRAAVGRELNLDIQTVQRFADARTVEELLGKAENRATKLDPWLDVVNQRWNEGITNAAQIHTELRARGYTGDIQTVRRYLKPLRHRGDGRTHGPVKPAPTSAAVPKPQHVSRWLLTHPDHLSEDDTLALKKVTATCSHLERLHHHIRTFTAIMADRRGVEDLPAWLGSVESDDLPALRSIAVGIRRDLDAVINGLSTEYNSGAVEGAVTRAKFLKRAGYGRAKFDLLRLRILLTP